MNIRRPGQPATEWHTLSRDWEGETVFIVCGGTSLKGFDFERLRGHRVMVINASYLSVPWADSLVFIDPRFYDDIQNPGLGHRHRPEFWAFEGEKICAVPNVFDAGLLLMKRHAHRGLSHDPTWVMFCTTTVGTGINVATLRGASRGILLGFDGKEGPGGEIHHHEPHPKNWPRIPGCFEAHGEDMVRLKPQLNEIGFEVINANPASAHNMFQKMPIDEVLRRWP